jgi:putative ABC transport system ATP-binding protein
MNNCIIEIRQVSKTYHTGKTTIQALKKIDFKVLKGDFTTIAGPSGSGKTTLLNILGLLDEPTEGKVYLYNKEIITHDFNKLATIRSQNISFIFQTFNLNPVLSVWENVMIPFYIRNDLKKEEKKKRVAEWLIKVGLEQHTSHRPDELSGGQRQRVAIARAMVTYPSLVLADEPTANLDSKTSHSILGLMKELNKEKQTAFVFSTHDPLVRSYAQKKYKLIDGVLS